MRTWADRAAHRWPVGALTLLAVATLGADQPQFPDPPGSPAPGWTSTTPEQAGMDSAALASGVDVVTRQSGIECLLVARSGQLIAEVEVRGDGCRRPHNIQSASKSVLSLLVGIALDHRTLKTTGQTLAELLPEASSGVGDDKREITLGQLLSMRSGLATTSGAAYGAWVAHDDWTLAALARPLRSRPGASFAYSTGNSHLVAAILQQALGEDLLAWSNRVLFDPLGITIDGWDRSPEGVRFGGNNFAISAVELLTVGQLVLDEGRFEGRQLVPEDWLGRSTQVHSEGWPDRYGAYGYLWWLRPEADPPAVLAVGYGGQFLYLVPNLELAVVVTSDHRGKGARWDRQMIAALESGIVGSVKVD